MESGAQYFVVAWQLSLARMATLRSSARNATANRADIVPPAAGSAAQTPVRTAATQADRLAQTLAIAAQHIQK